MFRLIISLLLSAIAFHGLGQQFNAVVATSSMDFLTSGLELENGNLIIGGFTSGTGETGNDILLIRMNHLGERVWTKSLASPGEDLINTLQAYDSEHFLYAGIIDTETAGSEGAFGMLDIDGNFVWQIAIGGNSNEEVTDFTVCSDGNMFIAGNTTSYGEGDQDVFIALIDATGHLEWSKVFGTPMYEKVLGTTCDLDGNFYIWGHQNGSETSGYDTFIMKFDANGDEVWNKHFSLQSNELAWDILLTPNGDLLLSGDTNSSGEGQNDIFLIRMNTDGDVLWSKTFGSYASEHGTTICKMKNDMYMITGGTGSFGSGGLDYLAMYVNDNGDLKYASAIGGEIKDISVGAFKTKDGGAVLLGNTRSFGEGYTSGYMVKINNSGRSACNTAFSTDFQSHSVEFNIGNAGLAERGEGIVVGLAAFPNPTIVGVGYTILCDDQIEGVSPSAVADTEHAEFNRIRLQPNPSNGYVKAYINLQEKESGKLEVFNLEGRLVQFHVFSSAMNGEVRAIQLQPLSRGVYLTRLSIGNAIETKKLIVE
ncbi:MAG: T9SS type A sorting domain-containing protein [Cryomorphaceae bacterium]|nr:T9SS type A sorting domain-containing protein [Cryomorphaceae bacterium]